MRRRSLVGGSAGAVSRPSAVSASIDCTTPALLSRAPSLRELPYSKAFDAVVDPQECAARGWAGYETPQSYEYGDKRSGYGRRVPQSTTQV